MTEQDVFTLQRELSECKHRLRLVRVTLYACILSVPIIVFYVQSQIATEVSKARTACYNEITACWETGTIR